jgi:hypothetical protein
MTDRQISILKEHIVGLCKFFTEQGVDIKPYPKVVFKKDNPVDDITAPTGNYQPGVNILTLYCNGRHLKDLINTTAHELWHRHQDVKGKLDSEKLGESTNYTEGNDYLKEIEHEAFLQGNVMRRKYTESLQKQSK